MMRTSLCRTKLASRAPSSCRALAVLRCATAVSAFGTLAGTSHAFVSPCSAAHRALCPPSAVGAAAPNAHCPSAFVGCRSYSSSPPSNLLLPTLRTSPLLSAAASTRRQTRLLFSKPSRKNYDYDPDEDKDKGFLEKAADTVKSVLPTNWFKSDEEKRRELARKKAKDEITGGISEVLKDAPLPVKMMGKVMGGLISNVASGLAEAAAEQSRRMEELMDDARRLIVADGVVADALGEPIVIGAPFSQSSSTSSVNGRTTVRIQSSFEVMGSNTNGVATMTADDSGISQLSVNVGGRNYNVDTSGRPRPGGSGRKKIGKEAAMGKGDVIDAEIIDAEYKEK